MLCIAAYALWGKMPAFIPAGWINKRKFKW